MFLICSFCIIRCLFGCHHNFQSPFSKYPAFIIYATRKCNLLINVICIFLWGKGLVKTLAGNNSSLNVHVKTLYWGVYLQKRRAGLEVQKGMMKRPETSKSRKPSHQLKRAQRARKDICWDPGERQRGGASWSGAINVEGHSYCQGRERKIRFDILLSPSPSSSISSISSTGHPQGKIRWPTSRSRAGKGEKCLCWEVGKSRITRKPLCLLFGLTTLIFHILTNSKYQRANCTLASG